MEENIVNKLEFKAGYHEWNIFINDNCFYTFGSEIIENIDDNTTYEDLKFIIDDCIETMQLELKENDKELLAKKYVDILKLQMLDTWSYHFGIIR